MEYTDINISEPITPPVFQTDVKPNYDHNIGQFEGITSDNLADPDDDVGAMFDARKIKEEAYEGSLQQIKDKYAQARQNAVTVSFNERFEVDEFGIPLYEDDGVDIHTRMAELQMPESGTLNSWLGNSPEWLRRLVVPFLDPLLKHEDPSQDNWIARGLVGGGISATRNMNMVARELSNVLGADFDEETWKNIPKLLGESTGTGEDVVNGLTQFLSVFSGLGGFSKGATLFQQTWKGGVADLLFDPEEGNIATAIRSMGVENEFLAYLDSQVGEDADDLERLEARLVQAAEGGVLGVAITKLIPAVVAATKWMKESMLETDPESYKKVIAQSTAVSTLEKTTLAELAKQNPSTTPKVPVNNVFLNNRAAIPKEKRVDIEDSEIPELPLLDIDVSKIVPTQKTISINNLEDVAKAKKIPESDEVLLVEDNGLFYVMDGHHRVANKILNADTSVQARVIKKDSAAPAAFVVAKTESENNQTTANFIKSFEGYRDEGYYATDAEKKAGIVTAGYGSTRRVAKGEKITEEQAEQYLQEDIAVAEKAVDSLVKVDLTPNQRTALVSLVFNVGQGNFKKSKALKALNKGDLDTFMKEAFDSKVGFVRSGGKVLKGLVKRREAERKLFEGIA